MSVPMSTDEFPHQEVVFHHDRDTGLEAIIAIHDTALGPAAGGCRRWVYANREAALVDVLRLSKGMTFKNALAEIPFGGGKSVILAKPGVAVTEAELAAYGGWIEALGGRYIAAEDVGIRVADMRVVARQTKFVTGLGQDGFGGDPAPFTAEGVFIGIQAAMETRLGLDDFDGLTVSVQGLGNVGMRLCERLYKAGAKLVVADINEQFTQLAAERFAARVVSVNDILQTKADVFAPCALGAVLTPESVQSLGARVVAGSANNQLSDESVALRLKEAEILYAPDYVINAGGVISAAHEYLGLRDASWVSQRIDAIGTRLRDIFARADAQSKSPDQIAEVMAMEILANPSAVGCDEGASQAQ